MLAIVREHVLTPRCYRDRHAMKRQIVSFVPEIHIGIAWLNFIIGSANNVSLHPDVTGEICISKIVLTRIINLAEISFVPL